MANWEVGGPQEDGGREGRGGGLLLSFRPTPPPRCFVQTLSATSGGVTLGFYTLLTGPDESRSIRPADAVPSGRRAPTGGARFVIESVFVRHVALPVKQRKEKRKSSDCFPRRVRGVS